MSVSAGTEEIDFKSANGYATLFVAVLALAFGIAIFARLVALDALWGIASCIAFAFIAKGLYVLQPNQAALMMLFGDYRGTDYSTGLRWANPFMAPKKISLRLRNFNSELLKVNDRRGNPIEIASAVVWRVHDTARAVLDIDDYEAYVPIQAEAAIRHLASEHSYDSNEDETADLTLRGGGDLLIGKLKTELSERLSKAGLAVEDARLTHLAYAPEIAGAMLRRQQADAVIAARKQIVLGAVSMVEMALDGLKQRGIVDLNDERRAAMVSNLLVVLCAETEVQPIVNTGTLHP